MSDLHIIAKVTSRYAAFNKKVKELIEKAGEMGKEAYKKGTARPPAMNKEFNEFLKDSELTGRDHIKLMQAYLNGWDKANLADSDK